MRRSRRDRAVSRATLDGEQKCLSVGGFNSWISHSRHSAIRKLLALRVALLTMENIQGAQGKGKLLKNTEYVKPNWPGLCCLSQECWG